MTTIPQSLAEAIREHRETCAILAIKASQSDADGEMIRAELDAADDKLLSILSALRSRDSVIEDCARSVEGEARVGYGDNGAHNYAIKAAANAVRSLSSHAETAGMVSVPVEPTEEMLGAVPWMGRTSASEVYRAMIKAAKGGEI